MKKELLSPVGNMLSLKMAIHNGADAVYLGGKNFGARKYAQNFDTNELIEATNYCHTYGVKIYVTVNTIIYETELLSCLQYVNFLYNIGVDAVIIQDIGLIKLIKDYIPNMEIHVSTQAHTHNLNQIKFLENLGAKRVVLAREMPLSKINSLSTNMDLEIFIHGALCICYSGQCLMSSAILNRSGNRGECAGLCRLPYTLKDAQQNVIVKDKYLLSPKDLATFNSFESIMNSKVMSLKIEGRMKSPEYVGYVTKIYRQLLNNPQYKLQKEEIFNLKSIYNRGFTTGFLFNTPNNKFINFDASNHQGVKIGEVIKTNSKYITIKLTHSINQGDAIRLPNNTGMYVNFLYDMNKKLINKGLANTKVLIDNKVNLKKLGEVSLTINKDLTEEINKIVEKKIPIQINIYAHQNEKLYISYSDTIHKVEFLGKEVEPAQNMPISQIRLQEALTKLGNTPFIASKVNCDIDSSIFISIGYLNEIRRKLSAELLNKRTSIKHPLNKLNIPNFKKQFRTPTKIAISVLARNEEQLKTLLALNIDTIYITDYELYNKYKSPKLYFRLNRVLDSHISYKDENLLIGETGSVQYAQNNNVISDYYLNVANSAHLNYLSSQKIKRVTLSPELNLENLTLLMQNINPTIEVEWLIYGTLELMLMKYDMYFDHNLKKDVTYTLEDNVAHKYYLTSNGNTHLFSSNKINLISKLPFYQKLGINSIRIELFDEDAKVITDLINKIRSIIA